LLESTAVYENALEYLDSSRKPKLYTPPSVSGRAAAKMGELKDDAVLLKNVRCGVGSALLILSNAMSRIPSDSSALL
jgi:hypothetical protein